MLDMPRSGHWWPVFALPFEKQTTVSLTRCLFAKIVAYLDPLHWLKTVKDMRYSDSSGSALYAVAQQIEAMAGIELEFQWVPKDAEVMPRLCTGKDVRRGVQKAHEFPRDARSVCGLQLIRREAFGD